MSDYWAVYVENTNKPLAIFQNKNHAENFLDLCNNSYAIKDIRFFTITWDENDYFKK